jgi:hypothetical protein
MPSILGNAVAILSTTVVGISIPDALIADLCARSTYCENTTCTKATLISLENCTS